MPVHIKIKRSTTSNARPATNIDEVGELALNFADRAISYQDAQGISQELLAVKFHMPSAAYRQNDLIYHNGELYRAKSDFPTGKAFNAADWDKISGIGPQGLQGPKGDQGDSIQIMGADTVANIHSKSGNLGDIWIATNNDPTNGVSIGDGLVSDGAGSGATHWTNIGQIKGDKGDKGDNSLIRGSDTLANIRARSGNLGDVWIATDGVNEGFGFISDGQGAGAAHWTNIGQIKGDRGEKGDGIHIIGSDTYAHIKAISPATLTIGDLYISTTKDATDGVAVGDGIVWDGTTWNNVGQIQGPMGASVVIQGHDTYANIMAKQGAAGDIWIVNTDDPTSGTDRGDGLLSDGTAGAGQWSNIGPIEGPVGPRGVKGDKGDQGDASIVRGSDTYADIITKFGAVGDIWIATADDAASGTDLGDGFISDGQGTGASHWTNIGQVRGPIGPQGVKGDQGDGYRVMGTAAPVDILVKSGTKGDIWIADADSAGQNIKAGDGLVSDGSGSGTAHWTNVGQLRGPQGLKGDKGDSYRILGSDTLADIQAKNGNQGDIWIATDGATVGHGYMSDGGGAGATHWTDVGQIKGDTGTSIVLKGHDTYVDILKRITGNTIGDIWISDTDSPPGATGAVVSTHDGLMWDGTQWVNIGQITGSKGDKGDPGEDAAIPPFDATENYAKDDLVVQNSIVYRAKAAVTAGVFDVTEWDQIAPTIIELPINEFDDTETYSILDLVTHAGAIFRAKGAITAGTFDPTKWDQIAPTIPDYPVQDFNPANAYVKDDVVVLDGVLYRAKAAVAKGAFDATDWIPLNAGVLQHNAAHTYAANDLVAYDGAIYRAKAAISAEPWDATHWTQVAPESDLLNFDATAAYATGDIVVHDGNIYKAKAAVTAGTFDASDWHRITWTNANMKNQIGLEAFSDTANYAAKDLVSHDGSIYRANAAVTKGPWDPDEWTEIGVRGLTPVVISSSQNGEDNEYYFADTTAGLVAVTLPTGVVGMRVGARDYAGTFDTNSFRFVPQPGELIEGQNTPLEIDSQGWSGILQYVDATKGWMIVESSPIGLTRTSLQGTQWKIVDSDTTAVSRDGLFVDSTAGPITITLPATPTLGDEVFITDFQGQFDTNNVTVDAGTENIMGQNQALLLDQKSESVQLVFSNAAAGWIIVSKSV